MILAEDVCKKTSQKRSKNDLKPKVLYQSFLDCFSYYYFKIKLLKSLIKQALTLYHFLDFLSFIEFLKTIQTYILEIYFTKDVKALGGNYKHWP